MNNHEFHDLRAWAVHFWRRVKITSAGCWQWTGGKHGRVSVNGRKLLAYRLAYELMIGPSQRANVFAGRVGTSSA